MVHTRGNGTVAAPFILQFTAQQTPPDPVHLAPKAIIGMVVSTVRDPVFGHSGWLVTSSSLSANRSATSQATSSAVSSGSGGPLTSPSTVNKCALSFILSCSSAPSFELAVQDKDKYEHLRISKVTTTNFRPTRTPRPHKCTITSTQCTHSSATTNSTLLTMKGTRFCIVNACMSLAKHNQRCWRHGGSIKCKIQGCNNRAKSKGVCWSHGGGTCCRFASCNTIAVSRGFCWAHGGGKRCQVSGCTRPGYERTQNYCATHYKSLNGNVTRASAVEYEF